MDEATFLTNIAAGYYLEEFTDYAATRSMGLGQDFSSGGFEYMISSPGGWLFSVYSSGKGAITTAFNDDSILITFSGDPVTAIGGQFFLTDYNGEDMNGSVTLLFSDTSTATVTTTGGVRGFYGNTFNTAITTLTITSVRPNTRDTYYPTVDHLYVGAKK